MWGPSLQQYDGCIQAFITDDDKSSPILPAAASLPRSRPDVYLDCPDSDRQRVLARVLQGEGRRAGAEAPEGAAGYLDTAAAGQVPAGTCGLASSKAACVSGGAEGVDCSVPTSLLLVAAGTWVPLCRGDFTALTTRALAAGRCANFSNGLRAASLVSASLAVTRPSVGGTRACLQDSVRFHVTRNERPSHSAAGCNGHRGNDVATYRRPYTHPPWLQLFLFLLYSCLPLTSLITLLLYLHPPSISFHLIILSSLSAPSRPPLLLSLFFSGLDILVAVLPSSPFALRLFVFQFPTDYLHHPRACLPANSQPGLRIPFLTP